MNKNEKSGITAIIVHQPKSNAEILKTIIKEVNDFVCDFQSRDRLEYLYEADIQADLAYKLNKSIGKLEISLQRDNSEPPQKEKLSLITREYPIGKRFDIGCINSEMIEEYLKWRLNINENKPIGDNTLFWELPLIAAIEIKYSILGGDLRDGGIKDDVEKLINYQIDYHEKRHKQPRELTFTKDFKYLALQFFQDERWFNEWTMGKKAFGEIGGITEFDKTYLIGKKKIFKIVS